MRIVGPVHGPAPAILLMASFESSAGKNAAENAAASTKGTPLIGQHALLRQILTIAERVARTDASVRIGGESGTGKELIARQVHAFSRRANAPFIPLNCGAIPGELLESELFGHEKGSFTGAIASRQGMFQLADSGTIFLDEIAEMRLDLQAKLLRVLQEHEIRPVGADRTVRVDFRVVAATNKDLKQLVEKNLFREDLYYRLAVIPVHMPALRERRSDVPLLVQHFLAEHNRRHSETPVTIAEDAMVYLWEYDWPGNVRELENLIERMVILADENRIRLADLPPYVRSFISEKKHPKPILTDDGFDLHHAVEDFDMSLIDEALRRTGGNKQQAARLLGLKRTTLVAKLRRVREGPPTAGDLDGDDDGEMQGETA